MTTTNPTPPLSSANRVSLETVESAVNALLKWRKSKSKTQKPQLLEQDDFLYLVLTLKKIPQKSRTNPHKIPLAHPLIRHEDDKEICLIIDDRPKSNLTKEAAMKKIKNDDIPISKVIKITKLKTDYRPFEAKRKLCNSYDMFFSDKRVVPLLPKLLGKQFFKKKKTPVPLDLTHKNWKEQIDKVCGSALLYLKTGTCSVLKVGKASSGAKEIVENVAAAIDGIAEIVPRKWGNIRSFHLKLLDSLALPVYQVVPDMKLKIDGMKEYMEEILNKQLDEGNKGNVKDVNNDSNKKKSKKGRIHEVRYMDSNIGEVFDEDELGSDGDDGESDGSEDGEHDQMDSGEVLGQKRKKGSKVKVEKLTTKIAKVKKEKSIEDRKGRNLSKKVSKVKKEDGIEDRKDDDVFKQKKQKKEELPLKSGGEDSSGKKEKKKSLLGKLKSAELKVKDKEKKKRTA